MARWRSISLGLLLVTLAACGAATSTSNQAIAEATATTASRASAAPSTAARTSAPGTSSAPSAPAAPSTAATATRSAPSAAPSATRPAGAAPSAPPAATAIPQPNGTIPAGWKTYRGTPDFPFVIAYPPDWIVDDSLLPEQRIVYFYVGSRDENSERIDLEISQTEDGADIDVQRDEFFRKESEFCAQKGIEHTEHRQLSGVAFAILHATCDASNELTFMLVASGLKNGDEWNVLMRTYYDRKDARLREVFNPMLASLNIYAKIP